MNGDRSPFALSIVVPVYNGQASVPTLVDELSRLDVPGGLEIVLVNDGSPDASLEVCRQLCRRNDVPLTVDRKSTRLNSSHIQKSRMPSSA